VAEYNRISGRVGNIVNLDTVFYHNGVPEDPYAIRRIDIYKTAVKDENLEAQVIIPPPDDPNYPVPIERMTAADGSILAGHFSLPFEVPTDFVAPEIYFDVWRFLGSDPGGTIGVDEDDESLWISQCNRFWVYPDGWYIDDELVTIRIGFEALDKHFRKPEIRNLEVGLVPLPLYDFDYNRIIPLIPQLQARIHIETENGEVIVGSPATGCDGQPCPADGSEGDNTEGIARIGLRQGSYRTNPFVVQYLIDTNQFLIGTYKYRIILTLPNGETRVSDDMRFDVA
jgi:hypothetical protein